MIELPNDFIHMMQRHFDAAQLDVFTQALSERTAQVSLRVHPSKRLIMRERDAENMPASALDTAEEAQRVPWCDSGIYLETRPTFTFDPLLHAGAYYVQEASSMFLAHAIRSILPEIHATEGRPLRVLDLCAAPGGKSTLLMSVLPPQTVFVCNEPMANRAAILRENVIKWGHPNVIVTNNYPADFKSLVHAFDLILVDAPCSGEGMFNKEDQAIQQWSPALVAECAQRQQEIVGDIWSCLRPGGHLIYSTCTYNAAEDEENVAQFVRELKAESIDLAPDAQWKVTPASATDPNVRAYHFFPHLTRGEGFFLSVLRKNMDEEESLAFSMPPAKKQTRNKRSQAKTAMLTPADRKTLQAWMPATPAMTLHADESGNAAFALTPELATLYEDVTSAGLRMMHCGLPLARRKGPKWMPEQALALSTELPHGAFSTASLTYSDALAYLRTEAITLPAEAPRGFVLVDYRGLPLGFVNNIGNRANNLYPSEWRIRTTYLPNA